MEDEGSLVIISDALCVLHDAMKLRAKDSTLNEQFADTALIFAPMGLQVTGAHLWSQRNAVCDALSRMESKSSLPEQLRDAVGSTVGRPRFHILGH